jgi:cysteine desulfurase family protein (TIGR01976 family)
MQAPAKLDIAFVRSHFPGLKDWALFENAGGTLVPRSVIDRVRSYMSESQVQPGGVYAASMLATERINKAERLMAEMINAAPEEIVIGPSTTMNIYVLAHALRSWFKPGDEVIVTNLDHEANVGAWRRLAQFGVTVKEWRLSPGDAELEPEELRVLLTEKTKLVCFTQCSNITGTIHDVRTLIHMIHDAGALACVDAVAYAPHRMLDVKALDVDFYVFSAYKLYGPHLGLLYGKREHLLRARGQNHFFIGEENIPLKLLPGGVNHELTAALAGITDYLDALYYRHFNDPRATLPQRLAAVFPLIAAHEQALASRFLDFLTSKANVRIIGRGVASQSERAPTFSFVVDGRDSEEFPSRLAKDKIAIRHGNFYARCCIDALGLTPHNGVVRASMVHYNTLEEVDRLVSRLDAAIG